MGAAPYLHVGNQGEVVGCAARDFEARGLHFVHDRIATHVDRVEGAEWGVLAGMRGALERLGDLSILMEFFPARIEQGGRRPRDVLDLLAAHGYGYRIIDSQDEDPAAADVDGVLRACRTRPCVNLICRKGP